MKTIGVLAAMVPLAEESTVEFVYNWLATSCRVLLMWMERLSLETVPE